MKNCPICEGMGEQCEYCELEAKGNCCKECGEVWRDGESQMCDCKIDPNEEDFGIYGDSDDDGYYEDDLPPGSRIKACR